MQKSINKQTDKVKFFLFAMFTVIPAVTGSLGIIPMLFYDLDNSKKEKMYAELLERRRLMNDAVESDGKDMLELAVNAQVNVGK